MDNKIFATRLKECRQSRKLSQEQLADLLGVAMNTVSRWELGKVTPDNETIHSIALALDVPMDYLEGLIDSPTAMLTDREAAEMADAEEEEMFENMARKYWKLYPKYRAFARGMIHNLWKLQEQEMKDQGE